MREKKQVITKPDRPRPGLSTTALSILQHQDGSDKLDTGAHPTIKLPSKNVTIGTWNVRTLYACGKINELEHELKEYNWDIIGLSEVRWKGIGETMTEEGNKIWFSGHESKHEHGVAFIVNKKRVGSILSCTPISSRIISLRIAAQPKNMTIIQIYAPTSDYEDSEIEEFYETLEGIIQTTPKKDIIIVQGDFNAKVGPDAYQQWAGTVGKYGCGETNERGLRLLEFAMSQRLTIANTLYPHKLSRRTTWHAPNGNTHNQIDFILVPKRFKSSVNLAKTRTYPGADIGSDHDLVLLNMKLRLRRNHHPTTSRIKFDLDKLKDPFVHEAFQAEIGGKFAALNIIDANIDDLTDTISQTLHEAAENNLGKQRKIHKPWISNKILHLCDERRQAKATKYDNPEGAAKYRSINNLVRKCMRDAKQEWIDQQCTIIDCEMARGNSKQAYRTLSKLTSNNNPKCSVIEDKNGKLLTESNAVLSRWTQYCDELYNHQITPDPNVIKEQITTNQPSPLPVLREEVEEAIRKLPDNKSPGVDNIPAELIKHGGTPIIDLMTTICQKIWQTKQWPTKWTQSLIIPIPKKTNSRQCQNHRTISLICHASKIMLRILLNRLKHEAEEHLAEEQAGFRTGRSTVEQIFNCQIIIEKHLQHQRDLYHNFIDFKKAFDRVWHEGLWHTLRKFNIEEGLTQTIEALYNNASSAVLLNKEIGEFFPTTVGVRQGCLLSPVLFNLFLEQIMIDALHEMPSTISIGGRPINNLRFADDIDLLAGSNDELQELTNRLVDKANAFGMELNKEKCKVMVNSRNDTSCNINIEGQALEEVNSFKYLGATLTKDGRSTTEIKTRIAMATSALARLDKIWKSREMWFGTKYKLYKSLVQSIFLYGCESWTLTAETTKRIQAYENKCLRRLLGISWKEHKTNDYVHSQVKDMIGIQESLLSTVKRRKLAWFGHVTRHNNLSKTVLQGTLEGGRKRGRQMKSWMDNIKEWTRMDSPTLIRKAEDRPGWRTLAAKSSLMSPLRPPGQENE